MTSDSRIPIETLALSVLESLGGHVSNAAAPSLEQMVKSRDYYAMLQVSPLAEPHEIEEAIFALRSSSTRLSFHVRESLDNAETVLLSPELRARYDASLT